MWFIGCLAWEGMPDWSPDARRIAFMQRIRTAGPLRTGISVMDARDGSRVRLTASTAVDLEPAWSPDGKRSAFVRARATKPGSWGWGPAMRPGSTGKIDVLNADGTRVTRLTHNRVAEARPARQPLLPPAPRDAATEPPPQAQSSCTACLSYLARARRRLASSLYARVAPATNAAIASVNSRLLVSQA